ncbi:MAG: DUF2029 domain-containing protein [Planctomycetales bacterium]|nr:DUF2029 domain-containing protein [Planctomycetales bacterium]
MKKLLLIVSLLACLAGCLRIAGRLGSRPGPNLPRRVELNPQGRDFVQDWSSARNYFEASPIYADLVLTLPAYLGVRGPYYFQVNAHPPASVLLTLPLGQLEFVPAFLIWQGISLLALLVAVWLVVREPELNYSGGAMVAIFALLLWSNVMTELVDHGPLNAVLFLLIVGCWVAQRRDHWAIAGALLGAAAAIKLFPAFLMLYFLVRRQYRALAAGATAFVMLSGISAAILGVDAFRSYYGEVVPRVAMFRDYWMNASITGFVSKLFDSPNPQVAAIIEAPLLAKAAIALLSLAVVAGCVRVAWNVKNGPNADHAWATTILGMLLVSPVTWNHYFLFALLPILVWWRFLPTPGWHTALAVMFFVLITFSPAWLWREAFAAGQVEVPLFDGQQQAIAEPRHVLSILSIQFYALTGWFLASVAKMRLLVN